jgi:hypothetical protein
MRGGTAVALLLVLCLGLAGSLHFLFAQEQPGPFATDAQAAIAKARNISLEQAAGYWLGAADKRKGQDVHRSGAALGVAIRLGRVEALRSGAEPVPDGFKRQFGEHFSQPLLDDARWLVPEAGSRLSRLLARWPVQEGAVTLGNVIVFKTEGASKNRGLFAHELAHVEQYDELGIGEFARRYAVDPEPIEKEARDKSRRVMRSL